MNSAILAADINNRIVALAQENSENRFNLLFNLIETERQRRPVTTRETLTKEQAFELRCLRDWLLKDKQREIFARQSTAIGLRPGSPVSDHERNCEHWLETLEAILK